MATQQDDGTMSVGFVAWGRKQRGPVAGPFVSREAARAHLMEAFDGNLRLIVRVEGGQR